MIPETIERTTSKRRALPYVRVVILLLCLAALYATVVKKPKPVAEEWIYSSDFVTGDESLSSTSWKSVSPEPAQTYCNFYTSAPSELSIQEPGRVQVLHWRDTASGKTTTYRKNGDGVFVADELKSATALLNHEIGTAKLNSATGEIVSAP